MAIWQFQTKLVPCTTAADNGLLHGQYLSVGQREEIAWWSGNEIAAVELQLLREVLPAGETWTQELEVFGDLEKTCVTILSESGAVVEVNARFDLRALSVETGKAILDFARGLECLLVTDDNLVLKPDSSSLAEAIKTSPAYRFVKDPLTFFSKLAESTTTERKMI